MRIDPSYQYLHNTASDAVGNAKDQSKIAPQSGVERASASNAGAGDTVQFSSAMGEVQRLQAQLANTPEVRSDRVAALQQQIEQGTYKPSGQQIAGAILSDLLGSGSGS